VTRDPLTARSVTAVVHSAGYPTGYRYRWGTGHTTAAGDPISRTGTEVARLGGLGVRRASGIEDVGEVSVYVITPGQITPNPEDVETIGAALREAYPDREVYQSVYYVTVSDDVGTPAPVTPRRRSQSVIPTSCERLSRPEVMADPVQRRSLEEQAERLNRDAPPLSPRQIQHIAYLLRDRSKDEA
jgi:hypothetical protein